MSNTATSKGTPMTNVTLTGVTLPDGATRVQRAKRILKNNLGAAAKGEVVVDGLTI